MKLGSPEVANQRPQFDFIQSVSTLEPNFASYWEGELNKLLHQGKHNELPSLFDLTEMFRNQRGLNEANKGKVLQSAFPASFQGLSVENEGDKKEEKKDEKKDNKDKTCLRGEKHLWKNCPYLIAAKRPGGWKPDEDVQKRITAK